MAKGSKSESESKSSYTGSRSESSVSSKSQQDGEKKEESEEEPVDEEAEEKKILDKEKRKFRNEMGMIGAYTCFVITYCLVMFFAHGDQDHYFNLHGMSMEVTQRNWDTGAGGKAFDDIYSVRDMYIFLRTNVIRFTMAHEYETSETVANKGFPKIPYGHNQTHTPNFYNKMIGGIRLRQRRMKKVECDMAPPFNQITRLQCFDKHAFDLDYYKRQTWEELERAQPGVGGKLWLPDEYIQAKANSSNDGLDDGSGSSDGSRSPTQAPTNAPTKKGAKPVNQSAVASVTKLTKTEQFQNDLNSWFNQSLLHRTAGETKDVSFTGIAYTYDADGFVADLPLDSERADAMLRTLEQRQWVAAGTRAIIVKFWTYNPVLSIVYACTLLFEMPSGGGVIPRIDQHAIKLDRYSGPEGSAQIGLEILFYVLLLCFVGIEFFEMKKDGCKAYCQDGWNMFDWVNLILFFATGIVRLIVHTMIVTLPVGDGTKYVEISPLITLVKIEDYCNSVSLFLLLFKFFKMLGNRFPRINLFGRLIQAASLDLILLVSLLVMFVFVFAFAGYVAFSSSNYEFRSLATSTLTAVRGVFGSLDFDSMYIGFGSQMAFSAVFFFAFQMVMLLVMINVFIAVVNEAWETVANEDDKPASLGNLYLKLLGQKSKVDAKGFFEQLSKVDPGVSQTRAEMIFKFLDTDQSGFIDEEEMKQAKYFIAHPADLRDEEVASGKKLIKSEEGKFDSEKIAKSDYVQNLLKPQDMQLASLRQLMHHKLNIILGKLTVAGVIDNPGHDIPIPKSTDALHALGEKHYDDHIQPPTEEVVAEMKARRAALGLQPRFTAETDDWQKALEIKVESIATTLQASQQQNTAVAEVMNQLKAIVEQMDSKVASIPGTITVAVPSAKKSAIKSLSAATPAPTMGSINAGASGVALRRTGFWARVKGTGEKYYHSVDGRKIADGPEAIEAYLIDKKKKGGSGRKERKDDSSEGSYSDASSEASESGTTNSSVSDSNPRYDKRR